MNFVRATIAWLALALACFLPASALTTTAPENCIWEISSIGYDVPTAEATELGIRTETSTSDYDTAPIHRADGEHRSAIGTCALFGPNAGFKAAEEAAALTNPVPTRFARVIQDGSNTGARFQKSVQCFSGKPFNQVGAVLLSEMQKYLPMLEEWDVQYLMENGKKLGGPDANDK